MMKKLIISVVAAALVLTMAGCGAKDSGGTKIKFATDAAYAPMEYMDKDKVAGFDIDFLAEVMKEAGLSYSVTNTGWDTMLTSVQQGKEYQAGISSVSITDERKQTYDYSAPYFESTNMILVKEGSPIKSALDLKDKKVAVQISTTADTLMTKIMGGDNKSLKRMDNNTLALMELESNGVDAVVADIAIIREYVKNNPNKKFVSIADAKNFESEYYGILLPKGSDLKAKLDPAIKKVIENGKYATVYKKWFGQEPDTKKLLDQK
ncbi:basic amino acid ABC transporter substrate-binding protein [Paenibacillus oryzisoli]|uniref:Glutamine ABC transporter substrate-binding protein n=1 Tax=Paenibacillus oryzisoli TaxID=1850517 RepID=A0A198AIK5_9BACL|nr:glutamine ABC transporter substrate-binding protein [Paenibacillus oryzisoli]